MKATLEKTSQHLIQRMKSGDPVQKSVTESADVRKHYRSVFENLVKKVRAYTRNPDLAKMRKAYYFAYDAHLHQLRRSGKPYIEHCLETAKILADMKMDTITVIAGLLHDVVEDTGITIEEVREQFGDDVAKLVDGVTKISELKFNSVAEQQAENFRKMIFSVAEDLRVIMIKFADRLHNMRTIDYLPKKKAERIALETREIYAPLAHRFGIAKTKWELEDLSLKVLEEESYYNVARNISDRRSARERYIRKMAVPIRRELAKNNIQPEITGRPKSIYSIYRKMKKRSKSFEEIYDLLALRIVVNRVDECYFVLGVVHTLFTPVHDRFKDYIATPKLNMYQSLHTTVIGPEGKMVEIQIRTHEMNRVAEMGIAAHWKYKEGKKTDDELDKYSIWLREMIDWQKETQDAEEYLDVLKTDLFRSEVFVFTPKGDLFKLPQNSTPLDFAFSVHTDVGMHCIGAKVNGRIVPLDHLLKNGDSIEILTSASQKPNRDWLAIVKTSKAKARIRRWLKETQHKEALKLGEEIYTRSLKKHHLKPTNHELEKIVSQLGKSVMDQVYVALGQGEISIQKIIEILSPENKLTDADAQPKNVFERFVSRARGSVKGVRVQGMDQIMISFGQCCHPVPGDPIMGFITRGRGLMIHRSDCTNALKLMEMPERTIEVAWDVEGEGSFIVQLQVVANERKPFLKEVAEAISALNTHIIKMDMKTDNAMITAFLILEVKNLLHLTKIIRRLHRVDGVVSVKRDSGSNQSMDATKS